MFPGELNSGKAIAGEQHIILVLENNAERGARAFFIINDQKSGLEELREGRTCLF
jgi:hypothetical protein